MCESSKTRHNTQQKLMTATHPPISINMRTKSSDMGTSASPKRTTTRGLPQLATPRAEEGKQKLNPSKTSMHPLK